MKRRKFSRKVKCRELKTTFIISVEGEKTEKQYISLLKKYYKKDFNIKVLTPNKKNHDSSPKEVLKRMEKYLSDNQFLKEDKAWLVLDRDEWSEEILDYLYSWTLKDSRRNMLLSNPKFEYWLLLHFEEGNKIKNSDGLLKRLSKYDYKYKKSNNKEIDEKKYNCNNINEAVNRARKRFENSKEKKWPRYIGQTSFYKLVSELII